jgi:tryptophan synthase alpha chain
VATANRIDAKLESLASQGRKGLVPYFSIGDPDMDTSRRAIIAAAEAGADLIELGVPFSDPIADGRVIQGSYQRALAAGATLPLVLDLVSEVRKETDVPLVLFGYYNPFFRYGEQRLAVDARAAGVDGILCVDAPPEESEGLSAACKAAGLHQIFLLAPTSDQSRIEIVGRMAGGFVYFVAVTGVTGARTQAPAGIEGIVGRVRETTGLPVGVGFGISTPEQAVEVAAYADLVVVGSALVRKMHEAGPGGAVEACREFVGGLRRALDEKACPA